MGYECFDVTVDGKVAQVRLDRPDELNTMVPAFWRELPEIVTGLSDAGEARAVVLSSTGRHFTAGMDLSVFAGAGIVGDGEPGRASSTRLPVIRGLQQAFTALERARVPVLAAVQGGCVGGGVDLVAACDMRYATADAFFVVQETNIGMTADLGTLQRLPKLVPDGVVRELAYTGRRLPAQRAKEVGLVNEVFADHDALLAGVTEVAEEIAARSPLAVWGSKEMLVHARDHSVGDGLEHVALWNAGLLQRADLTEALQARSEGREPRYDDLPPVERLR